MLTADPVQPTPGLKGHTMTEQDNTPDMDLDDTEGHTPRPREDEDDTEGHAPRPRDDEDDTEGHGPRPR